MHGDLQSCRRHSEKHTARQFPSSRRLTWAGPDKLSPGSSQCSGRAVETAKLQRMPHPPSQPQENARLVQRLSEPFLGLEKPGHAGVLVSAPQVGCLHPLVRGQTQFGFVRGVASQPGRSATSRMVHSAAHSRSMNRTVLDIVHLDLPSYPQAEHAEPTAITQQIATSQ